MGFVNEKTVGNWRTVDYERDAVLIDIGTNRESYTTFELTWKGAVIQIIAHRNFTQDDNKKNTVYWNIIALYIPTELEGKRRQIIKMLLEAIDTYGLFYDRTIMNAVHITFDEKVRMN